jgi:glycosyltransferase involved in cell wall biosynthesis
MKICKISRPPLRAIVDKFLHGRDHILRRIEIMGHEVYNFVIEPLKIPNHYLAYGLGMILAPLRFKKIKPDLLLADNVESGIAALLIKSIFNIPFIFNFVDDYSLIAGYDNRRLRYWMLKFFEKIIPKFANIVIVVDLVKKNFCLDIGIPESRLRMVPNGVDTDVFKPEIADRQLKDRLGLSNDRIVLFVGQINKYYKLETILRAVPAVLTKFPETQLLFVGDGDNLKYLKGLSRHLKVESSVVFAGFRPPKEIPKIINLSDICVFPLPDSSALTIFEYMACAKPVVLPTGGTGKMGIPKEMFPEDSVLMVKDSSEGFAQGINFLLNNSAVAEKIGQRAREAVIKSYDWNALSKKYERALKEALDQAK